MKRHVLSSGLALGVLLGAGSAAASERSLAFTEQSRVYQPGQTALAPWTTLSVGRERYYSRLDARLEVERGLSPGTEGSLSWNFSSETRDVVADELTGELSRVSRSELSGVTLELKQKLTDPYTDALGSALQLRVVLGPAQSVLSADAIFDRELGRWAVASQVTFAYALEPLRGESGTELATSSQLSPRLGVSYRLSAVVRLGLELGGAVALERASSALFGGPVLALEDRQFWLTFGVQPQLVAFSGQSDGSVLDLASRERVKLRLIAGFLL